MLLRDNIYQSENVVSPFVLGMIKPKVYLPFHIDEQDMEHVIAHEQAHIRRKDYWWKPVGFLLVAFYWFNPLMWLGYVLLCRDIELACDEKVIKELNVKQKADYSQALLNCSVNRRIIAACPLAFGEVSVKDRVKLVLNYKKPAIIVSAIAIIISIIVAACFLTNPKTSSDSNTAEILQTIQYGGIDSAENNAADVVRMYYTNLHKTENDRKQYFTDSYNQRNVSWQDIKLIELLHCEVVDKTEISTSDMEWVNEIASEYYAYCFVQTSDIIVCEEDGALGIRGEEVSRNYCYTLIMETKDSTWKIYDFGYPPKYVLEKMESREKRLQGTSKGIEWKIEFEQEFSDYILCATSGSNQRMGIAVFRQDGRRYKLVTHEWCNDSEKLIKTGFFVDGECQHLIWCKDPTITSIDIIYRETISETIIEQISFEVSNTNIICTTTPLKDYRFEVVPHYNFQKEYNN